MVVLNIAVIGSDELARSIAKATDQRDVHTYVHKENGPNGVRILSLIRPAKFPERLPPFLSALSTSHAGIIEITGIDSSLGEVLVAFASAGIQRGIAVINPPEDTWVDQNQVKNLFTQAGLTPWTFEINDGTHLRERMYALMDDIQSVLEAKGKTPLVLPVDQYFNVKGIGLVAIGYVQSGRVNIHDDVLLLPANGIGSAKSLQVMDDDVEVATAGDRVGLALRNTKEEHLTGSTIIVHPPVEDKRTNSSIPMALDKHVRSILQLETSPFQKRILAPGDVIHASVDLQFIVGRVVEANDLQLIVDWEHPLFIRKDSPPPVIIAQLDSIPRIMGPAVVTPVDE